MVSASTSYREGANVAFSWCFRLTSRPRDAAFASLPLLNVFLDSFHSIRYHSFSLFWASSASRALRASFSKSCTSFLCSPPAKYSNWGQSSFKLTYYLRILEQKRGTACKCDTFASVLVLCSYWGMAECVRVAYICVHNADSAPEKDVRVCEVALKLQELWFASKSISHHWWWDLFQFKSPSDA